MIFLFSVFQRFNFSCILGGKGTRSLWNNGQQIVWDHFIHLVNDEINSGLKLIPKLTLEHVYLTPYSVMNVCSTVKVLSSTVANVLRNSFGEKTNGAAELCEYMGKSCDCLNVRNEIESLKKRKSFLQPYTNLNDERFKWLKKDFLQQLLNWKMSIIDKSRNFSLTEKDKMFLFWKTYEGPQITFHSIIEAVKYLLGTEMSIF